MPVPPTLIASPTVLLGLSTNFISGPARILLPSGPKYATPNARKRRNEETKKGGADVDRRRWLAAATVSAIFGFLVWHAAQRPHGLSTKPHVAAHEPHRLLHWEVVALMDHAEPAIRATWIASGRPPLLWSRHRDEYYFRPGPRSPNYGSSALAVVYLPRSWPPPGWTRWGQSGTQDLP